MIGKGRKAAVHVMTEHLLCQPVHLWDYIGENPGKVII